MSHFFIKKIGLLTLILACSIGSAFANAEFSDRFSTHATVQQEANNNPIQMAGVLNCATSEDNNGESCLLTFTENNSGKTFSLRDDSSIMQMYQDGNRNVSLKGYIRNNNSFEVTSVFTQ